MSKNAFIQQRYTAQLPWAYATTDIEATVSNVTNTVPALDELKNDKEKEKQMAMKKKIIGLREYTRRTPNM